MGSNATFLVALGVYYRDLGFGSNAPTGMVTRRKNVKGVEIEISEKTLKVGNFSTKTAKPKFSKIRQKSNFGPIVRSHM